MTPSFRRLAAALMLAACAAPAPAAAHDLLAPAGASPSPRANTAPAVQTPAWVQDAVFYQIFPERFANGDRRNDPRGTEPWGGQPKTDNYFGGDLDGVRLRLPHLQALGVNAIYLNPIFTSDSNHKYHTTDYEHVDPAFGGDRAFDRLIAAAHARGIKVILDGVFNHTGDTHPFFLDAARRGEKSPYWRWYQIHGLPVVKQPKPNYEAWWGLPALPQLQVAANPQVARYVFQIEEQWLRRGIDGWRLDVPNEIKSEAFWREFRRRAKAINPQAYVVGEIWDDADAWLQGDQFDAVMNYPWRGGVLDYFAKGLLDGARFDQRLKDLRGHYHPAVTRSMFNLLGSHDTERFLTLAGGEVSRLKQAVTFQMTYPGAPVIYYGDEVGMQGGKDPDDRRCFDWDAQHWDAGVWAHYQRMIALRKAHVALRRGGVRTLHAQGDVVVLGREAGRERAVVAFNRGATAKIVDVPVAGWLAEGTRLADQLGAGGAQVRQGTFTLRLDPRQSRVLLPR